MATTQIYPRIAIIGGGPGGLVLLRTLHLRGIPATLYERETSVSSRMHLGGTLDLAWESGQRAFRENELEQEFKTHSRLEGDDYTLCDAAGNILLQLSAGAGFGADRNEGPRDPKRSRPEIDRSDIRKILVQSVPTDSIKWGHALATVRPLGGGQHALEFANGASAVCDILVGADGAHSRVRPLLSPATPGYMGVTGVEISLAPGTVARPEAQDIAALVGNGSLFVVGEKMLGAQRNSDGRIRVYAWFRGPEDWALPGGGAPEAVRGALGEMYEGLSPVLKKLIEMCDDEAIYLRALYALPVGHRWVHVAGVTLVGDAGHLITPFAGAGANLAMLDGLELGIVLADAVRAGKSAEEREAAIAEWEEKMFVVAGKAAAICKANLDAFTSVTAPQDVVEMAKSFFSQEREV